VLRIMLPQVRFEHVRQAEAPRGRFGYRTKVSRSLEPIYIAYPFNDTGRHRGPIMDIGRYGLDRMIAVSVANRTLHTAPEAQGGKLSLSQPAGEMAEWLKAAVC
jgi:hypothetical protein